MHVIFGQDLEGCPLPESIHGINRLVLGPRGLIDFLELHLGLPPVVSDRASRLLDFREALRVAEQSSNRFYSSSFAIDPFGSSKVLLRWRDDLCLNAWDPEKQHTDPPSRLRDMAEVEAIFRQKTSSRWDDSARLAKLDQAVAEGLTPKIEKIELLETVRHFPLLWRNVLEKLNVTENSMAVPDAPIADPGTRLHAMQARLLGIDSDGQSGDASIRIVEGAVLSKNADAAAGVLLELSQDGGGRNCLISDRAELEALDQAVRNLDAPSVGSGHQSSLGALEQLAPVVLRLHWGPFNPQAWLEFFLHPVRPISPKLAGNLAFALNRSPSREHADWKKAIDDTIASTKENDWKKRIKKQVKSWLNPREFTESATTEVLAGTTRKLADWMARHGAMMDSDQEKSTWLNASASIKSLAKSIESIPSVTREDLERIISEWLPGAAAGTSRSAELGAPLRLTSPAHLLTPADHVIWWQPREQSIARMPWTSREIAWLAEHGIKFPDTDLLANSARASVYRAILNARQSLTMFHCPQSEMLDSVMSPLAVRLSAEFGEEIIHPSESLIKTEEIEIQPLAGKVEAWQISCPERLTPRENESFSSLSKFIYSPWDWVLNYKARLRAGPQVDSRIVDDARRQGSLLHGFVESLLEPEPDPLDREDDNVSDSGKAEETESSGLLETLVRRLFEDKSSIKWQEVSRDAVIKWVEDHWEETLALQAAHYLVPGNEASRSELLYLAKNAIWELLQQLRAADIVSVTCEEKIADVKFCGGKIGGFIDLKVTNKDGEVGLIDLKLGGLTYRRDELSKGRHLQLAVYGHLVESIHGKNANCAYFIFSGGGTLLARSNRFFPKAEVVKTRGGSTDEWKDCWNEFESFWGQRRAQLNTGRIELESSIEFGLWEIPEPNKYSDFMNLTGWEPTD